MTGDILSTIDGALTDYATSKDAMRWAPPETQPEVPPMAAGGIVMTLSVDLEPFLTVLRAMEAALADYTTRCAQATATFTGLLSVIRDADREHAAALSVMHRAYHQRRKARARRKRGR